MIQPIRARDLRRVAGPIAGVLALAGVSAAQSLEWTRDGVAYEEGLGADVAICGDADGDGLADLLVGAVPSTGEAGKAFVYSSASPNAVLLQFAGDAPGDGFGRHVGDLGDVDGDGLGDYAIAAPDRVVTGLPVGAIFVWSGSGALLRTITSPTGARVGLAMAVVGDQDGDGVRDLLYSESGSAPAAVVVSGATGATIRSHAGTVTNYAYAVGSVGDADADGIDDYAICEVSPAGGLIHVHAGATGALLFDFVATPTWVKTAGDADGDGHADLVFSRVGSGLVRIVSGATGGVLQRFTRTGDLEFGRSGSTVGDFDGDGMSDVAISRVINPFDPPPLFNLYVYSGATGSSLAAYHLLTYHLDALDGSRDVGGDGKSDYLIGSPKDAGLVELVDTATNHSSWLYGVDYRSELASSLVVVGDRDGDGWRDLALLSPGGCDAASEELGAVQIVSGLDGHELSRFVPGSRTERDRPQHLAAIGDVDGDGVEDLAVACPGAIAGGWLDTNAVELRSGADDSLLATIVPPKGKPFALASAQDLLGAPLLAIATLDALWNPDFWVYDLSTGAIVSQLNGSGGGGIACMGDVDQDGLLDWALNWGSSVTLWSGSASPTAIWNVPLPSLSLASVLDLDGDGIDDLLVTDVPTATPKPGKVTALSGVDGTILFTLTDTTLYTAFGQSLASLGDLNRDGFGDFAVGAPTTNFPFGAIHVYSGRTATPLLRFDGETDWGYLGEDFANVRWHEERSLDPDAIPDLPTGSPGFDLRLGRALAFRMDDLLLQIDPASAAVGQKVTLLTRGGPGGAAVGLYALALSGTPLDFFLAFGVFDAVGDFAVQGTVPPGLSGTALSLKSFAIGFGGKVVDSQTVALAFL